MTRELGQIRGILADQVAVTSSLDLDSAADADALSITGLAPLAVGLALGGNYSQATNIAEIGDGANVTANSVTLVAGGENDLPHHYTADGASVAEGLGGNLAGCLPPGVPAATGCRLHRVRPVGGGMPRDIQDLSRAFPAVVMTWAFSFPRTTRPPHRTLSAMIWPFFSTVTTPHVSMVRRAVYCVTRMSSSFSDLLQYLQVMDSARRPTSCGLSQYRQTIVARSSGVGTL